MADSRGPGGRKAQAEVRPPVGREKGPHPEWAAGDAGQQGPHEERASRSCWRVRSGEQGPSGRVFNEVQADRRERQVMTVTKSWPGCEKEKKQN